MGIRLVMEAADRHLPGLTWRERHALLVLAASAIDATRELPPGIEDRPELMQRLGLSRTQLYIVLDALREKDALVRVERGRHGTRAVYAIAPYVITPESERPGDPDAPPVDNPSKRPSNRDPSTPSKHPGSDGEASRFTPSKHPGSRDASGPDTVFFGIKGFKTGGGTPPPPNPQRPLFPFALPDVPPEEGGHPEGEKPATDGNRRALAAEIRKTRPGWSARSILRALERPSVAERPWPIVAEAMRILAADQATQHPGRLEHDGPWWAEAARKTRVSARPASRTHQFDPDPETRSCRVCKSPQVDKAHTRGRTA